MKSIKCYLICSTQRSGSNYLASGLISSKIAGNPNEFFVDHIRKVLGIEYDMLDTKRLIAHTKTPNGVFGARIMWQTFQELMHKFQLDSSFKELSQSEILSKLFPNIQYIYLTRKDKVRQAISFYKAIHTNIWRKEIDGKTLGHPNPNHKSNGKLKFSFKEIQRYADYFHKQDENWRKYFHENNIKIFSVIYEELIEDYENTIIQLLEYLKIKKSSGSIKISSDLVKQADSLSDKWIKKYKRKAYLYNNIRILIKPFGH